MSRARAAGFISGRCGLRIVADDLTGALDTAGVFAGGGDPVYLHLGRPPPARSMRCAIDTDSRDLTEAEAELRTAEAFRSSPEEGAVAFKKIDSVMRGHPIAEAAAAFRAGNFESALYAPAFPEMGRVTRGGRQFVLSDMEPVAVGPDAIEAFAAFGLSAAMIGDEKPSTQIIVADAKSAADLARAVEAFGRQCRQLYIGSAGLAFALSGHDRPFQATPHLELAVFGTAHPMAKREAAWLRDQGAHCHVLDGGSNPIPDGPAVFSAPADARSSEEAAGMITRSLIRLVAGRPPPRAALVSGGWTLRLINALCRTDHLACLGLCAPGIALSRAVGGRWDGTLFVSKSGGFAVREAILAQFGTDQWLV